MKLTTSGSARVAAHANYFSSTRYCLRTCYLNQTPHHNTTYSSPGHTANMQKRPVRVLSGPTADPMPVRPVHSVP